MSDMSPIPCPDCDGGNGLSRREFVRKATGTAVATGLLPFATTSHASGGATEASAGDTVKAADPPLESDDLLVECRMQSGEVIVTTMESCLGSGGTPLGMG